MMPRSICFVTEDQKELDLRQTAAELARRGWIVHVLYHGPEDDPSALARNRQELADQGIGFSRLGEFRLPISCRVASATPETTGALHVSNLVRHALEVLLGTIPFQFIEFSDQRGPGLRTIQAKRAGLAFANTQILVKLHGPSPQVREEQKRWTCPNDVLLDYCERYAFENADRQISLSEAMLASARSLGWKVQDQAVASSGADVYEDLVPLSPAMEGSRSAAEALPLVTVAVTHHNLGAYLPEALASLAGQTYPHLEVLVIDDGSTCPEARKVLEEMEHRYPRFRFLHQSNQGPGAARNRGLQEARGEYFLPVDADNIALPTMAECLATALRKNPTVSVMTCFSLAFVESAHIGREDFLYLFCPIGGPHIAACVHNVYGDTNAIFRTADLRRVGGFETNRATCCEDLETFVKLVHGGYRLEVVPEPLYYYRRRPDSLSGTMTRGWTDFFTFQQRVLKEFFFAVDHLPPGERQALWTALAGFLAQSEEKEKPWQRFQGHYHTQKFVRDKPMRYQIADGLHAAFKRIPGVHGVSRSLLHWGRTLLS